MTATWKPIAPLSDQEKTIDESMPPIYEAWKTSKDRLASTSPAGLSEFNRKLIRRLSIETGILERLYDLDRGTTEALVADGFLEDYVSRADTDIEPSGLIDILHDHEAAIQLVVDGVAKKRPLSKGFIHELHDVLTKHQNNTIAVDQLGNRREIPLLKGKFKQLPNNPRRPDGTLHEYCPPEHVDSEIEKLIHLVGEYESEGVDPVVRASWMHHRFTQIHPFQDGNGRVVRTLTTLLLLRSELLPLVIDRDLRVEYIGSLENADGGNLDPLVSMVARLQRNSIMQALSLDVDAEVAHQQSLADAVLESLAQKFGRRKQVKHKSFRKVDGLAIELRQLTHGKLLEKFEDLRSAIKDIGNAIVTTTLGGPDEGNDYWYKREVVVTAKKAGKYANFSEGHYFVKVAIAVGSERLVFVISYHHVGRELTGIMEATAFAVIEADGETAESTPGEREPIMCSVEPFVFTYNTQIQNMDATFERWLDAALAVAFKEFGDHL